MSKKRIKLSKNFIKYLIIAGIIFLAGIGAEFFSNCKTLSLKPHERGRHDIPMERLTYEGFHEEDGKLVFDKEKGFIHIPLDGKYVDKLVVSFDYDGLLNMKAYAGIYNIYGEVNEKDELDIIDRNLKVVKETYLNVGARASYVNLVVEQTELMEPGLSYIDFQKYDLAFTGFSVSNTPVFHFSRLLFYWCLMGLAPFLSLGRNYLGKRIEVGFLVVSISVGFLMVASLPANKVGWDEEVHFEQAFWLSNYRRITPISESIHQEFSPGIDTWPLNQPGSYEEQRLLDQYLDATGDYRHGNVKWSTDLNKTTMTGYMGEALFLKTGQLARLPFSLVYRLGRLGNLLLYSILMFFAIKKTPVGKGILTFIGLMPTPLFLASTYSYDPSVTAFICLSFALILKEILTPKEKITWKSYAAILILFILGCRIKEIYAPLILIALLIPKEKFRDKKEMCLMRAGIVLTFVGLMLDFMLPVLLAPKATGDLRGGATSEAGQMSYILGQPLAYSVVLVKNIIKTLPGYVLGENAFGMLGHLGTIPNTWMLYAGAVLVILTNTQTTTGTALNGKQKIWIFVATGAVIALIWTALYISYTEPGNTFIDGVQGRYYIPFLFPVYLLFNSRKVIVHMENSWYYTCLLGMTGAILMYTVYGSILVPYCL